MRVRFKFVASVAMLLCMSGTVRAQEPPSASAPPVKLADLVAEAEQNHPAIRAAARMVDAKRTRVAQVTALPDPKLSVGWMGNITPFDVQVGDPSSYRSLSAMQEIPYPGKLALRGRIAAKEADAETWNVEAVRRRIRAEVKLAYYELLGVQKTLETQQRDKELLEKFARIAEEKYKVGNGLQQDVLRAQVEVSRILLRLTITEQRRRTLEARLNSLLIRPPDATLGPLPAELNKSGLPYSLEELIQRGVDNDPEIRRQEQLIEQGQLAANLARREVYPDLSVGYMYQNRPRMPEMHGFTFTINLPIFSKNKQREAEKEANLTVESIRQTREAIRTDLFFKIKEQYLAAKTSDELLLLYSKALVPQSALTLESSMAAYQVGSLDFLSLITNFITVLDYETSYYEELARYQQALARLEELTGIELDGASGSFPEVRKP
jgi:cobalt-zinc-cadmium efflux system outer membrane protein